ncbi:glutamine synthetase, catalytic region [Alkaliphilus metalliredigens QYMF]|uniref:Glutamine synthetase n=1 Tax=Alkaliphilus metalliredigens (strain QYMF) TaxID=293826 RepID=A6TMQ7_ALKMQ|nr:glutamine synthetase [Alkaliphilus metalliredigens]ABR47475.1 glutamine synthetase, catalytic region [Alkaliphilus metalliredigens QYMF]
MNQTIEELLSKEVLYTLPVWTHEKETLIKLLKAYPFIQFASLVAVDLGGNDTDEKIPISLFIDEMDEFLTNGVQTDGSSVVLHGIATLNNAKVDMVPDLFVNWFIDYNYDHIHEETGLPIGTLRIPAFLVHDDKRVDSRSVLNRTEEYFDAKIKSLFKKYPSLVQEFNIDSAEEIEEVKLTSATELEFWVKTPEDPADEEKLSTSQMLKEQYWKRTKGNVRTALEESLMILEKYGFEPEMGHKEVGGVTATIGVSGKLNHVMEQLEIDWKYSTALQCADNELFIRELVEETFERYGLEVTFMAKPIEGVAGSGKHVHISVTLKLKNGKYVNLFSPQDMKKDYISAPGWGALMGLLRNYEVINPFVTATNDAFNRLKPGFEAPVCIVGSVGHTTEVPSRNRTVLVGLVRDTNNPLATRFELRAPNPTTNTYLTLGAIYQTMMDGMTSSAATGMTSKELEKEFSKDAGEEKFYLDKERAYRSEEDVFEDYTEEERTRLFSAPPATVWENLKGFTNYPERKAILLEGDVFSEAIVDAYRLATLSQWVTELMGRIIPNNMDVVRNSRKRHQVENATDLDVVNWEKINSLRNYLMKDSMETKSLFTRIREAVEVENYDNVSELQIEMAEKSAHLKQLYYAYRRNLLEELNDTSI